VDAESIPNPYQAPRADLEPGPRPVDAKGPLASRWQRLGGATVDVILTVLAHATIYLGHSKREVIAARSNVFTLYLRMGPWGNLAGALVVSLALVQWFFITRRGQSIGKMAAGSRIVRMNGAPVGFLHGVVIRNWTLSVPSLLLPLAVVAMQTTLNRAFAALAFIDVVFIFGASKRCLHDQLADTKVIDLSSEGDSGADYAVRPERGPLQSEGSPKVFSSGRPMACMIDTRRSVWPLLNSR
jgi:uncharacterized RDD family membrane protein YckC